MRPDLLDLLDAHWAARLGCAASTLRNQDTNIISDPDRAAAEVWLFDKTCVMVASPPVTRALKASVGTRAPLVAFEPSRLKEAVADFRLALHGPEAILVLADCSPPASTLCWIPALESDSELAAAVLKAAAAGIPAMAVSLKQRVTRRLAETAGFELYASAIFLGERPSLL
jgi:hypothetical protein